MELQEDPFKHVIAIAPVRTQARLVLPDGSTVSVTNGIAAVDARWIPMLVRNGWTIRPLGMRPIAAGAGDQHFADSDEAPAAISSKRR